MTDLICISCKNSVALSDLKADKSGSGWVCLDCYKHQHPEVYKPENVEAVKETKLDEPPKFVKFYCSECGYKFKKEPDFHGKCPYCNLYSIKEEKDADTLLRDSIRDLGIDHVSEPSNNETKIEDSSPKIEIVDD
jgi:DNA-directed RNA polymerase subunit RPC12/RpoP